MYEAEKGRVLWCKGDCLINTARLVPCTRNTLHSYRNPLGGPRTTQRHVGKD